MALLGERTSGCTVSSCDALYVGMASICIFGRRASLMIILGRRAFRLRGVCACLSCRGRLYFSAGAYSLLAFLHPRLRSVLLATSGASLWAFAARGRLSGPVFAAAPCSSDAAAVSHLCVGRTVSPQCLFSRGTEHLCLSARFSRCLCAPAPLSSADVSHHDVRCACILMHSSRLFVSAF